MDASAWIAIAHRQDSRHEDARTYYRSIMSGTKLVTSDYVLGESITFLTYHQQRHLAIELHALVQAAVQVNLLEMEWITPAIHDHAWEFYQRFADQKFSYCDCTSFAICAQRGVDSAFTFDSDFARAGFQSHPA